MGRNYLSNTKTSTDGFELQNCLLLTGHFNGFFTISVEEGCGQGTRLAAADGAIVHTNNRHHLARGAGQERFVGAEQVVVVQHLLAYGDADFAADLEEEGARDAGQEPRVERRRQGGAVSHDEETRLRALGELALVVAHHAFVAAAAKRLLHRERVVERSE